MDTTQIQLAHSVEKTAPDVMDQYRRNDNWRLFQKEWICRKFPPTGRSWLDFGCGTGEITTHHAMLGAPRVVDATPGLEMTRRLAKLDGVPDRVQLVCGDISSLEPQPVDIVLSFAVLHDLPDHLQEVIPEIRRHRASLASTTEYADMVAAPSQSTSL